MRTIALVLCLLLSIPIEAQAAPPRVGYQGVLTDSGGAPLNGSFAVTFRIYALESGGSPLWGETHAAVAVSDGVYSVELGSQVPLPVALFDGGERFIEVQVGAETLVPRQRLASVPYALSAQRVEQSPISSLSQLAGLPCNAANPAAGSLQIMYAPSGAVTFACSNLYVLTVTIVGGSAGGIGTAPPVTSVPAGIICSAGQAPDCSETYVGGTQVTLSTSGNLNFSFIGWSGACTGTGSCVITLDGNRSVTATFTQNL